MEENRESEPFEERLKRGIRGLTRDLPPQPIQAQPAGSAWRSDFPSEFPYRRARRVQDATLLSDQLSKLQKVNERSPLKDKEGIEARKRAEEALRQNIQLLSEDDSLEYFATELFGRLGLVGRREKVETRAFLRLFRQEFATEPPEQRREYPNYLGKIAIGVIAGMRTDMAEYAGIPDARLESLDQFVGFVIAVVSEGTGNGTNGLSDAG